jgi:SAM-dependent methyltransferase
MDAEATTFPNDFFDIVVITGVLHHLDLDKAYAELARILKPAGEIICTEALRHNVLFHTYRKLTPHLRSEWEVAHILGKAEIRRARHYFDGVKVVRFFHLLALLAVPFRRTPVFSLLRRTLDLVDRIVLAVPGIKWQAWMAVFVLSRPRKRTA